MANLLPVDANTHYIAISDGAATPTFSNICGINQVGWNPNVTKRDTAIWDCENPQGRTTNHPTITGASYSASLSGFLDGNSADFWRDWYHGNLGQNRVVRYYRTGGYFEGPAVLSSFEETGNRDEDVTVSATLDFIGEPTWTAEP